MSEYLLPTEDVQEPLWIAGEWRQAVSRSTFQASNPATGLSLTQKYPVSDWDDCAAALDAAVVAARELKLLTPDAIAAFLEAYASILEAKAEEIAAIAHQETGLPIRPRLLEVEMPRTLTQLRQAAAAAREGSWQQVVIDSRSNIRSHYAAIGPVLIFGPNNFPFAFHGIAGGDFAAAIAAGCPVIAKAHPLHPGTSKRLAQCVAEALQGSALPLATVQMIYHLSNEDGLRMVSDSRLGACSFTGSRGGGLRLKSAADAVGKPIYLEMSSLNPVVLLPGAVAERGERLANELADSCLAASGQFCTSPNLILAIAGSSTERLATLLASTLSQRPSSPLLSEGGLKQLDENVRWLVGAGAIVATGASKVEGEGWRYHNTLLRITGRDFLKQTEDLQREAFGNSTLLIVVQDSDELDQVIMSLEGNLTGSIYTDTAGSDDTLYSRVADTLRSRVGRLLNDKMPTGVALSPAMNHGGPFPATSHPGFTSVGIPRSMLRFGALQCYDAVREDRLPDALRERSKRHGMWRLIDGNWERNE
jgi:NADP-dependent aldehyde dehydrogenase